MVMFSAKEEVKNDLTHMIKHKTKIILTGIEIKISIYSVHLSLVRTKFPYTFAIKEKRSESFL